MSKKRRGPDPNLTFCFSTCFAFPPTFQLDRRTLFANFEQLVCFPRNHTSRQSTPAPFNHTAQDLYSRLVCGHLETTSRLPHHGLSEPQLLHQGISTNWGPLIEGLIKVIADESARGTRIGAWTEREEQEGGIES